MGCAAARLLLSSLIDWIYRDWAFKGASSRHKQAMWHAGMAAQLALLLRRYLRGPPCWRTDHVDLNLGDQRFAACCETSPRFSCAPKPPGPAAARRRAAGQRWPRSSNSRLRLLVACRTTASDLQAARQPQAARFVWGGSWAVLGEAAAARVAGDSSQTTLLHALCLQTPAGMNRTSFPGILMLLAALSAFAGVRFAHSHMHAQAGTALVPPRLFQAVSDLRFPPAHPATSCCCSANCPSEASNQNVLAVVNRYRALHG